MRIKDKIQNLQFLIKPWWDHGKPLLLGSLISALFLTPVSGWFSATLAQAVIDEIQLGNPFRIALNTGLKYVSVSLCLGILKALFEDFYCHWKKRNIEGKIDRSIYEKSLAIDYRHFDNPEFYDSYKLTTEKFTVQSSETIQNIFSLLNEAARFLVYAILIASHSFTLFLIVLLCSSCVGFAQIYWSKVSVERELTLVKDQRKTDYLRRLFFDHTAVADMRSSNIKVPLFNMFDRSISNQVSTYKKYGWKEFVIDILVAVAQLGTTFAVPTYVAWGIISGKMESIGVYATLIASSLALKEAMNALSWWASQISLGIAYAQKARLFFEVDSEIETSMQGDIPEKGPFSVKLEDVSYAYPNSTFAIKNLNISIKPGEKIAIVGENGAGKTTLTKLLLRLYDVNSGTISINGKPISSYSIVALREKIGVAFQDTRLYALSVGENMTAYASASADQLERNLIDLELYLDLNSQVTREFDDNGIVLSGGDSQRLCLSRLLHSKFGLLILDEPSSALDPIAEYKLAKQLFSNSPTTTIMIAHRLSTIVDADKIYLLSNGSVVEVGTHVQLMERNGRYKEMFMKQAEGYIKGKTEA